MACHMDAVLQELAEHLDVPTLLSFGACGRAAHWLAMRAADDRARASFEGVCPLLGWGRPGPHWRRLGRSLKPRQLCFHPRGAAPSGTRLLGAVLGTRGPWFVEFELTVARAPNGTPCVGLLDARAQLTPGQLESGKVPRDLSRVGSEEFAVSFSPESGKVFASGLPGQRTPVCTAGLNWRQIGDSSMSWNAPLKAGLMIKDRQLTLYRGNMHGQWRSSGVILRELPDEVIPAVFMTSFVGFASVRFLNLWQSPPDVCCADCDMSGHGLKHDWCTFPSSNQ